MAPLRLRDVVAFSHNNLWSPLPAKFRTSFRRWTLKLLYLSSTVKIITSATNNSGTHSHEMAPMWHRNIVAFDHNKKKYAENGRTFLFNLPFWNKSGPVPIFGHAISPCAVPLWQTLAVKWLPCDLGIFRVYVTIANNIACIIEGSYSPMAARFMEANSLSICLFKLRILAKKKHSLGM